MSQLPVFHRCLWIHVANSSHKCSPHMYPKTELCQNLLCRSLPQTKAPRSQVVAKRFWASLWQFLRGSPLPPCKSQLLPLSLISFQCSSSGTQWLKSFLWEVLGRSSSFDASSRSSQPKSNPFHPSPLLTCDISLLSSRATKHSTNPPHHYWYWQVFWVNISPLRVCVCSPWWSALVLVSLARRTSRSGGKEKRKSRSGELGE